MDLCVHTHQRTHAKINQGYVHEMADLSAAFVDEPVTWGKTASQETSRGIQIKDNLVSGVIHNIHHNIHSLLLLIQELPDPIVAQFDHQASIRLPPPVSATPPPEIAIAVIQQGNTSCNQPSHNQHNQREGTEPLYYVRRSQPISPTLMSIHVPTINTIESAKVSSPTTMK